MPFNISKFKTTFDKYGGPARASLFEVTISKYEESNSAIRPASEFSFFCKSAQFPGLSIQNQVMRNSTQLPQNFPSAMDNSPFTAIFLIDSDYQILTYFHNWMQKVLNYSTRGGKFAAINADSFAGGQLPYEVGYKDDFSCRISLKAYSTESDPGKFYEVIMENAYPFQLGNLDMAWEQNDSFLTLPVSFSYDSIHYSGDQMGNPSSRSKGILETLSDLAGFADVVNQTIKSGKPTSIQDAINRLTRVRNSFGNLTEGLPKSSDAKTSQDAAQPKTGG